MKKEITLCFEFLCNEQQVECCADEDLTLQEVWEGLIQLCPEQISDEFDLDQPVILCCKRNHRLLDTKKAIAQLRLLEGDLILVY